MFKKPEERSALRRLPPQMGITWVIPTLSPHTHGRYAAPIAPPHSLTWTLRLFWGARSTTHFDSCLFEVSPCSWLLLGGLPNSVCIIITPNPRCVISAPPLTQTHVSVHKATPRAPRKKSPLPPFFPHSPRQTQSRPLWGAPRVPPHECWAIAA